MIRLALLDCFASLAMTAWVRGKRNALSTTRIQVSSSESRREAIRALTRRRLLQQVDWPRVAAPLWQGEGEAAACAGGLVDAQHQPFAILGRLEGGKRGGDAVDCDRRVDAGREALRGDAQQGLVEVFRLFAHAAVMPIAGMRHQRVGEFMRPFVGERVGTDGRAHEAEAEHVPAHAVAVFAIVEQRETEAGLGEIGEARPATSNIAASQEVLAWVGRFTTPQAHS